MDNHPVIPAGMHPVAPQLVKARYLVNLSWVAILAVLAAVAGYFWGWAFYIIAAVIAVFFCWLLWLIPQQVKNLGWLETEDELLLTRGKLWHKFTVVPYGRIQFVDVTAGPVMRKYGMKSVRIHTASPGTDAVIKGLPAATADALRERLALTARERMSGL